MVGEVAVNFFKRFFGINIATVGRVAACLCVGLLSNGVAGAPPSAGATDATAYEWGSRTDIAGMRKLIAIGEPNAMYAYFRGIRDQGLHIIPMEVEVVIAEHFEHPTMGKVLRDIDMHYQTRKVFDLHAGRIRNTTNVRDPSFNKILWTYQTGIETDLAALAKSFPREPPQLNTIAAFLGNQRHAAAIPLLIDAIADGSYYFASSQLAQYPSIEVWRMARQAIEASAKAGRIPAKEYKVAAENFDDAIARANGPRGTIVYWAKVASEEALKRRIEQIQPSMKFARRLLDRDPKNIIYDPKRYVLAMRSYLSQVELIAKEMRLAPVAHEMSNGYCSLGTVLRFRLSDINGALEAFSTCARYGSPGGDIAAGDIYQFAMRDNKLAIAAYQSALAKLKEDQPMAPAVTNWERKWLRDEIRFLQTGKPFHGALTEQAVNDFFHAMRSDYSSLDVGDHASRDFYLFGGISLPGSYSPQSWQAYLSTLRHHKAGIIDSTLRANPPSHLLLRTNLKYISLMSKPEDILKLIQESDPNGYWATPWLTAAQAVSKSELLKQESLSNRLFSLIPGLAAPHPGPMEIAAGRFMESRLLLESKAK